MNVLVFRKTSTSAGYRTIFHTHIYAQLDFVLRGAYVLRVDQKRYPLGPGEAVFVPGGARHSFATERTEPCELYHAFLKAEGPGLKTPFLVPAAEALPLRSLLDYLWLFQRRTGGRGSLGAIGRLLDIELRRVRKRHVNVKPSTMNVLRQGYWQLAENVERFMLENLAVRLSVRDLAKRYKSSVSSFAHLFGQHFGQGPLRYWMDLRVDRAKEWLVDSALSVSEIAARLGFPDVYSFSRVFKRRAGVSPLAFRKNRSYAPLAAERAK